MANWFPAVEKIADNGFGGDRAGWGINGAIIHHTATTGDAFGYMAQWNDRDSHPTYHIYHGFVRGIVHPNRRPYSTGHDVDAQCITLEINNTAGAPDWNVGLPSLEATAQVLAFHARESGFSRAAKSIRGVDQAEFFIGWHSQYSATACPGPEVSAHLDWIVNRVNEILNPPAPTPTPEPVKVVWSAFGPMDMVAKATVNIFRIGTGEILGTIAAGTVVTISSEVTIGSVRYFRSSWATERGQDNGLDASLFAELTAPVDPEPVEPTEPEPVPVDPEPTPTDPEPVPTPDPIDVIIVGPVTEIPMPETATQVQYPGKAVLRTIVAVLAVALPAANVIAVELNKYFVSQELAEIPGWVYLTLNGVIIGTGLVIGAVTRIMAIPGFNRVLTFFGLGATPKAVTTGKHVEGQGRYRA